MRLLACACVILLSVALAAPSPGAEATSRQFVEDDGVSLVRNHYVQKGYTVCQTDGAFDTWCQDQNDGSVSVACVAKEGNLLCCTGWAGSGLPHPDDKCRLANP